MPVGQRFREAAVEEEKRLLYVSMTRARDLLIFGRPARKPSGEWLDILNASWLLPAQAGDQLTLPDGSGIPYECWTLTAPPAEQQDGAEAQVLRWFPPTGDRTARLPLVVSPSRAEAESCAVLEHLPVGQRIALGSSADMQRVGSAIHGCIAAAFASGPRALTAAEVAAVLSGWEVCHLASEAVLAQIGALNAWLAQRWPDARIHCEIPVEARRDNGQLLKGQIDLLLETSSGWVLIDHKSNPGGASTREEIVQRYGGQLRLYKEGVERATGRPVVETWLYFPVAASAVRVQL
jgi:ATP-dependent exoDNAse (exonuclease V) beta subunit